MKSWLDSVLDSGESAEPCSARDTTGILTHCKEVKGEMVTDFIFPFVSAGFTGDALLEGIWGGFSKAFVLVSAASRDRGVVTRSVGRLDKHICQHGTP